MQLHSFFLIKNKSLTAWRFWNSLKLFENLVPMTKLFIILQEIINRIKVKKDLFKKKDFYRILLKWIFIRKKLN